MIVLGLDPGIARLGWAILSADKGKVKAISFYCFETKKELNLPERIFLVHEKVSGLIKKYKPDCLSIEEIFFSSNAKTAFSVGQSRGVCILAAEQMGVPTYSYTPLQVKVAVTGYGKADKYQVGQMVKTILGLKIVPKLDDTSDALAVAITHAFSYKMKGKI